MPNKEKNHSYNPNLILLMKLLSIFMAVFVIMHSIAPAYAEQGRNIAKSVVDNLSKGALFDYDKFPKDKENYYAECMEPVPENFLYQMTRTYLNPFEKLGAICRITKKYYCDENEISLSPIEKSMMQIYNKEGKQGNYLPILKRLWGDFDRYICTVRPYDKAFNDKRGGVCLRNLQLVLANQTENCPNKESMIHELTLTSVQIMRHAIFLGKT